VTTPLRKAARVAGRAVAACTGRRWPPFPQLLVGFGGRLASLNEVGYAASEREGGEGRAFSPSGATVPRRSAHSRPNAHPRTNKSLKIILPEVGRAHLRKTGASRLVGKIRFARPSVSKPRSSPTETAGEGVELPGPSAAT